MKAHKIITQTSQSKTLPIVRDLLDELNTANKVIAQNDIEKKKREKELIIANKELKYQQREKANRASELLVAEKELEYQKKEKQNRADELALAKIELAYQSSEKADRASELLIAEKELKYQKKEKQKRAAELAVANKELAYQSSEKADRASELLVSEKELAYQQSEKADRAIELLVAEKELAYQQSEKSNRASELLVAEKELTYQQSEKANRESELLVAHKELAYQQSEKADRASELGIANKELAYQQSEKADRASELGIANKELAYQQSEKADRASELGIANKELAYQQSEKADRASELGIANKELAYQRSEKADRASELGIANKELAYQRSEKADRASELGIANKELAYQQSEKADRASELIIVQKTIIDQEVQIENLSFRNDTRAVFNHQYFLDAFKKYDNKRNLPISIIMGDINGLAIIDDSLGHSVVDDVQAKLNTILKRVARKADIIICLSNGEFSLVLPKTNYSNSLRIIKKIKSLSEVEKAGKLNISISCGSHTKTSIEMNLNDTVKEAIEKLNKDRNVIGPTFENKTIDLIMEMLFEKNNREMLHSSRVSEVCANLAQRLDFDQGVVDRIRITGMLHDIGKIGIDEGILNKSGKLNDLERNEIRKHPEIGYRILNASNEFLVHAEDVLEHHERMDGTGYPKGLMGDEISIVARIIAIADTYDALMYDRPYRKAGGKKNALMEIQRCSGTQFDVGIVKVFVEMMNIEND
jgi:diguanylate cyclase (GGDEF)-like protein